LSRDFDLSGKNAGAEKKITYVFRTARDLPITLKRVHAMNNAKKTALLVMLIIACAWSVLGCAQGNSNKDLYFKDIKLGQAGDASRARKDFDEIQCANDKVFSRLNNYETITCRGTTVFAGQKMNAFVEIGSGRQVKFITLDYDVPNVALGIGGLAVSAMEDRLITAYGLPNILRTESPRQSVQYPVKDLINGDRNQGADQWAFANGASIVLEPGVGHKDEEGGAIYGTESIMFAAEPMGILLTLPARSAIPVVLETTETPPAGNNLWETGKTVTVEFYPGGERTCVIGTLTSSQSSGNRKFYASTLTCTDFVQIRASAVREERSTKVSIVSDRRALASGFVGGNR
jgi:hypothetical protein